MANVYSEHADHDGDFPSLGPATRVLPIYVFGDSHSLGYRDTVVSDELTGQTIATKVRYFSTIGCTAASLYSAETGFHPELIAALEHEGLIRFGRLAHLSFDDFDLKIGYSTGLPQAPPLILINCGEIDLRSDFLPLLKDERDFVLPDDNLYPTADVPLLPYDICMSRMEARMSQLVRAVAALRAYGFVRTFLHCIVPPSRNDELFVQVNKYRCPASTRYKAAVLCNRYLAEQCKQRGIPFIDIWPEVTSDGYLRPEYELDGIHLAPGAVRHSLKQVLQRGVLHDSGVNYRRYELFYQLAKGHEPTDRTSPTIPVAAAPVASASRKFAAKCKSTLKGMLPGPMWQRLRTLPLMGRIANRLGPQAEPTNVFEPNIPNVPTGVPARESTDDAPAWVREATATFDQEGICTVPLEPQLFQKWRSMLDYSLDVGNRNVTVEWYGNSVKPFNSNLRYADPPQMMLDDLAYLFGGAAFTRFFQKVLGCPVMLLNCRPFMSVPHQDNGQGPQAFHRDGCPAGIFRGILYLTDVSVDSGPFEYQDSCGESHLVTAPAGTLLLFDANRLLHRGSPPRNAPRKALDLIFCARLPGQPMLAISAGINNWPYDPFQYTLAGMKTSPPLEEPRVSLPPFNVSTLLPLTCYKPRAEAAAA